MITPHHDTTRARALEDFRRFEVVMEGPFDLLTVAALESREG